MGFGFRYDQAGRTCSGRVQEGTSALRAGCQERWLGLGDLGIYNCRPASGGGGLSLHGEGRAWDAATVDKVLGDEVALVLVVAAQDLGVQRVIWWRREWDSRPGERHWEPYTGPNPHTNHLHVELCWPAARTLTVETVRAVLGVAPIPAPPPPPPGGDMPSNPPATVRVGDTGQEVRNLQGLLNAANHHDYVRIDGEFGPITRDRLADWQARAGLAADGICGPCTWQHLLMVDVAGC